MKSGLFEVVDHKNKRVFIEGSNAIDNTIRTVRMRLRSQSYSKTGNYGKVQEFFKHSVGSSNEMRVGVYGYCKYSDIEKVKEKALMDYFNQGYTILNQGWTVIQENNESFHYKKISEVGFPPPDTRVLVTFGDLTIYEIAEWYYDENCQVKWQRSTMNRDLLPEHRIPTHWRELPTIKSNTE